MTKCRRGSCDNEVTTQNEYNKPHKFCSDECSKKYLGTVKKRRLKQNKIHNDLPPADNYDLSRWKLTLPDHSEIQEDVLNNSYESEYFYTGNDGSMVLTSAHITDSTEYPRCELREMLRDGKFTHSVYGVNPNNWVSSSSPIEVQKQAGGVDGTMNATVAVNRVSTTGDPNQVGRVVIGQIHANHSTPVRIYYRLMPGHDKGIIYFVHETCHTKRRDIYTIVGDNNKTTDTADPALELAPEDGIALNEKFSYTIDLKGNTLIISIIRPFKPTITKVVDITYSGYNRSYSNADGSKYYIYMFFKAGSYCVNNTADLSDYTRVSFYSLRTTHNDVDT